MYKSTFVFASALALASLLEPSDAEACRCMQPNIRSSFANNDTVIVGRISRTMVNGNERIYTIGVRASFKGCATPRQTIIIKTAASSATVSASSFQGLKQ